MVRDTRSKLLMERQSQMSRLLRCDAATHHAYKHSLHPDSSAAINIRNCLEPRQRPMTWRIFERIVSCSPLALC